MHGHGPDLPALYVIRENPEGTDDPRSLWEEIQRLFIVERCNAAARGEWIDLRLRHKAQGDPARSGR
ncbi:MAG TPA: hypothetical protein VN494_09375 [Patescibacteria group bacterium]|nr:hypothetical protein [Patescibacteria group bacterium]